MDMCIFDRRVLADGLMEQHLTPLAPVTINPMGYFSSLFPFQHLSTVLESNYPFAVDDPSQETPV